MNGRPCSICTHPARKAIEAAVRSGTSTREAEALYPGVSKSSLGRHLKEHVARTVSERVAPIACEVVPDPLDFLSPPPPPLRIRERLRPPVEPEMLDPLAQAGNVVPFLSPTPVEPEIAKREEATPLKLAILFMHGYGLADVAKRFDIVEEDMSGMLAELDGAYESQATGSNSPMIIGRLIFETRYAISELERDYQDAKSRGRHRDARENRRMILMERQGLFTLLKECGVIRPLEADDFDSKGKQDKDDILAMVKQTMNGVYVEPEPVPLRKPRLIG